MAFRFFRRIRIAPGLSLNLSKRGGSLSFGPRGAKLTAGTSGIRRTVSLPGTGLWYTEHVGKGSSNSSRSNNSKAPPAPKVCLRDRLNLKFFEQLTTPKAERDLVAGLREFAAGNPEKAYEHLKELNSLPDAAFLAGMIAIQTNRLETAEAHLRKALRKATRLGSCFQKYGIDVAVSLPITNRISAQIGPSSRGIRLALAEIHQALGKWEQAVIDLRALHAESPGDIMVILALCEILCDESGHPAAFREVVNLTQDVTNESEIHTAVLLWKGKALRLLRLNTAARDTLTAALRRKKGRSQDLLNAIQYERALVYEALRQWAHARREFEKLYAQAPDYEDVAERLSIV